MNLRDLMNKLQQINEADDPTAVIQKYMDMGKNPTPQMPAFIDPKDGKVKYLDPSSDPMGMGQAQPKQMPSDWIERYAPDLAAALKATGGNKAAYGTQEKTGLFGIKGLGSFDNGTAVNTKQVGADVASAAFIKTHLGNLQGLLAKLAAAKPGSGNTDPALGKVDYSLAGGQPAGGPGIKLAPADGAQPTIKDEPGSLKVYKEGFELNESGAVTLTRHDGSQVTFDPETLLILEDSSMAGALLESFGYASYMSESELAEYSWDQFKSDASDTARGAWQGATLGAGNNIAAGVKSAFGPGKYKDELAKQIAADKEAQERSPWLYGAGNVAGALAMPVPGGAVANALGGAAKLGKVGAGAVNVGANLATQMAVDKGVNKANTKTLGYNPDKYPTTPEEVKAFQQANGLTPDGKIGPKTQAVLQKMGLQPATVQEQISSLRDRLAIIESAEENVEEGWWDALSRGVKSGYKAATGGLDNLAPHMKQGAIDAMKNASGMNKAGQVVGKVGGAIKSNPGKTAAGALAGAGGAMTLGGTAAQGGKATGGQGGKATGSKPDATKPADTTKPDAPAGPTPEQLELIKQIQAEMAQLADIDDPAVAKTLADAQKAIDAISAAPGELNKFKNALGTIAPSNATANTTGGPANMGAPAAAPAAAPTAQQGAKPALSPADKAKAANEFKISNPLKPLPPELQ